jgi:hypothetical protein
MCQYSRFLFSRTNDLARLSAHQENRSHRLFERKKEMLCRLSIAFAAVALAASAAHAEIVYNTGSATGFYTPFSASTPAGTKFGDSGWFGNGSGAPTPVGEVQLGLATYSTTPQPAGTVDLVFTFNNGDPSGLVFGNGATLFSTVVTGVELPATDGTNASYFDVVIPTPGAMTTGGFNNVGWSVGVQNYSFGGSFGFQNRGGFNSLGFYTNNASEFNPATNSWHTFAFGPNDPADIANFVATIYTPEPASLSALVGVSMILRRRR